jgi:hypothetical protein
LHHIQDNPSGAPQRLFHAEETVHPFKADFPYRAVNVGATVLADEIKCLAICSKMDGIPLLLEIMAEVEAAGCMSEPFPAHNKEQIHGMAVIAGNIWCQGLTASDT